MNKITLQETEKLPITLGKRDLQKYKVWDPEVIEPNFFKKCTEFSSMILEKLGARITINQFKKYMEHRKLSFREFKQSVSTLDFQFIYFL